MIRKIEKHIKYFQSELEQELKEAEKEYHKVMRLKMKAEEANAHKVEAVKELEDKLALVCLFFC